MEKNNLSQKAHTLPLKSINQQFRLLIRDLHNNELPNTLVAVYDAYKCFLNELSDRLDDKSTDTTY